MWDPGEAFESGSLHVLHRDDIEVESWVTQGPGDITMDKMVIWKYEMLGNAPLS